MFTWKNEYIPTNHGMIRPIDPSLHSESNNGN